MIESPEILGVIIASATALGAGAIPTGKWMMKKHKENQEAMANKTTNNNTIALGSNARPVVDSHFSPFENGGGSYNLHGQYSDIPEAINLQLHRMEKGIAHIENLLITEGQVHHTQTTYLDGLRNEVSKLREDIIELRVRMGNNK